MKCWLIALIRSVRQTGSAKYSRVEKSLSASGGGGLPPTRPGRAGRPDRRRTRVKDRDHPAVPCPRRGVNAY